MICDLIVQVGQQFVGRMRIFFINMNTLKHSFVITGHLHWLQLKLPYMYATGWTTFDGSQKSWVCDSMLVSGILLVSIFISISLESAVDAWVSTPE